MRLDSHAGFFFANRVQVVTPNWSVMMSKVIYGTVIILIILLGIIFAVLNSETVQFNYYFNSRTMPLSLAIILAMFIGAILGVIASIGLILRYKREVSRLRKAADVAEKEITNLRAIPIKNQH